MARPSSPTQRWKESFGLCIAPAMPDRPLPKEAILVVNTLSRRGAELFERGVQLLREAGVELIEAHAVTDPARIKEEVKRAVDLAPMVIVGGGDGTLSTTIDFFKDHETVFAILPCGTANSFARALGIPLDLPGAVDVIANGRRRRIDLGCINGDYFGNSASIGLSPMIARTVPHKLKKYLGRVGYALWAAKVGLQFRPFRTRIGDGRTIATVWATEVRIANGGFFGGVELVEGADLESGEIIVQIVTGRSSTNLAKSWFWNMLRLRHRDQWQAEIRAKRLKLDVDPPMDVTIDGEIATRTPITVTVAPCAVAIAAPRDAP
jgi:YegS/Rv2252/BmrU family lipid kinase